MERKQQWFRSDVRCAISPRPLPLAQVENSPEDLNGLTKKLYHKFAINLNVNIANNTCPERCFVMKYLDLHCCLYASFIGLFGIIYA